MKVPIVITPGTTSKKLDFSEQCHKEKPFIKWETDVPYSVIKHVILKKVKRVKTFHFNIQEHQQSVFSTLFHKEKPKKQLGINELKV